MKPSHRYPLSTGQLAKCCLTAATLAAAACWSPQSPAQERVQRSTADVRPRPVDELDRPRYRERSTHRGFEVRTNQLFVVANTRPDDARWAAEQAELAWKDFGRLADAWTTGHRHPDFGIGAVQIYIDGNPPKDRDLPLTTINVVGIQTQITLHVLPGQPKLEDQLYLLRKSAVLAFLHTAEMDRQIPSWTCDGLAAYVAAEGMSHDELKAEAERSRLPGAPHLGGEQWRFQRGAPDRLDEPAFDHEAAAHEIRFLLEGNDGAHAPALFAAIRDSMAEVNRARAYGNRINHERGEAQPSEANSHVNQLAVSLASKFEEWQREPFAGQPVLELDHGAPAELKAAQKEMAVVLKLARRFGTSDQPASHTRITAFDKERGMTVLSRPREAKPIPIARLYEQLTRPDRPLWATLDAQGRLLISTERERVGSALGVGQGRYEWSLRNGKQVLTARLDDQRALQGWLEENSEVPSRPLAKFAVVELADAPTADIKR